MQNQTNKNTQRKKSLYLHALTLRDVREFKKIGKRNIPFRKHKKNCSNYICLVKYVNFTHPIKNIKKINKNKNPKNIHVQEQEKSKKEDYILDNQSKTLKIPKNAYQ